MDRHSYGRWLWVYLVAGLLVAALAGCALTEEPGVDPPVAVTAARPMDVLRLFIIYGGDVSAVWSGQIRTGLIEGLVSAGDYRVGETLLLAEYKLPADVGELVAPGRTAVAEAIARSQEFAPDVLITVGTQATQQVVAAYPDPSQPIVFCAFHGNVLRSGLHRANVTGVLESPYPLQTARLALNLVPGATRFMVLGDVASTGNVATEVIFEALLKDPPYPALPVWRQTDNWVEWQSFITETDTVDFVILGKHDHVRDSAGTLVPAADVLRWTLTHSAAPVFGLWQQTVTSGAVGGLVLTGQEQGDATAELVLKIAHGGDPAVLLPQRPERNILAINLAAVRHWELSPPFEFLVTASFGGTFPEP